MRPALHGRAVRALLTAAVAAVIGVAGLAHGGPAARTAAQRLADGGDGRDWAAYGATNGAGHYSPLTQVDGRTVGGLGLAWSMDLPRINSVTEPLAVDGVLYFGIGHSVVHAVDARTGRLLWKYDPEVYKQPGDRARMGFGDRGVAWWDGKVLTATLDGRLIALDARTGKRLWSVQTLPAGSRSYITGPPRVFDGKVVIGFAGADIEAVRGYVTAYDAGTGKKLWRFYTVPGEPAKGFEDKAMEMAAKTWFGEWWKQGGGGTVWNAITYDKEQGTVLIGVGNGAPWNQKIRSQGKGDNLFLASIVALDARTGAYRWHYQVNPGETWDYVASMDIELGHLTIDGRDRQVLVHAPKNGFLYVIDRTNGKLISAKPFVKTTWATSIDLVTGRPNEDPAARYPDGGDFLLRPSSFGGHSWLPMAFSPQTGLVYIPASHMAQHVNDRGIDTTPNWKRYPTGGFDGGVGRARVDEPEALTSELLAWDPVSQKAAWSVPLDGSSNGAVMATGGGLVFQGEINGTFNAYDARTGRKLWTFQAGAPVIAPPITYMAGGRQYVTVLTGLGTGTGALGDLVSRFHVNYWTQAHRVLTFQIGGTGAVPPAPDGAVVFPPDPTFDPSIAAAPRGVEAYGRRCGFCHGGGGIASGLAPDLRASMIPRSPEAFKAVVHDGARAAQGMPRFPELDDATLDDIRQYVRIQAAAARKGVVAAGSKAVVGN